MRRKPKSSSNERIKSFKSIKSKNKVLTIKEEEKEEKEEVPIALDSYFINNKIAES